MLLAALHRLAAMRRLARPQRQRVRYPSSRLVDWRDFGSHVHHVSQLADVSDAGAFVHAATPSPVGSAVVAEIGTAWGVRTVHARVAWVGYGGMGLRFTRPLHGR